MRVVCISLLMILLCGCSTGSDERIQEDPPVMEKETEDEDMNSAESTDKQEPVQILAGILGCSERTAQSVLKVMKKAASGDIVKFEELETDPYRTIRFEDEEGTVYFAEIGSGYFTEKIYKNSLDGEVVYKAMR